MNRQTELFLDFTEECAAVTIMKAYATDYLGYTVAVGLSKPLAAGEYLIVTYLCGDTVVSSHHVTLPLMRIPNAVLASAGEYEAHFAVYGPDGSKLTSTCGMKLCVAENAVIPEGSPDCGGDDLFSDLISDYDSARALCRRVTDGLNDVALPQSGKNLFDASSTERRLISSDGALSPDNLHTLSEFIPFGYRGELSASCTKNGVRIRPVCRFAAYTSAREYIAGSYREGASFIPPLGAEFIRVCFESEGISLFQLEHGAPTAYEAFSEQYSLRDGSVKSSCVAVGAVTAEKLAEGAVTTAKISGGAVTAEKLANGAVTAEKLANGAVTAAKLANGAVTADKVSADIALLPVTERHIIPPSGWQLLAGYAPYTHFTSVVLNTPLVAADSTQRVALIADEPVNFITHAFVASSFYYGGNIVNVASIGCPSENVALTFDISHTRPIAAAYSASGGAL